MQSFTNFSPIWRPRIDGVAGIADVSASSDVIRMQDIEAAYFSIVGDGCSAVGLGSEECFSALSGQEIFLGEGDAVFHHFVPDTDHVGKIIFGIASYSYLHSYFSVTLVAPPPPSSRSASWKDSTRGCLFR